MPLRWYPLSENLHHQLQNCNLAISRNQWRMLLGFQGAGCTMGKAYHGDKKGKLIWVVALRTNWCNVTGRKTEV